MRCSDESAFTIMNETLRYGSMTTEVPVMSLTRSLNLLMISASFVFVGALIVGVMP